MCIKLADLTLLLYQRWDSFGKQAYAVLSTLKRPCFHLERRDATMRIIEIETVRKLESSTIDLLQLPLGLFHRLVFENLLRFVL